MCGIAGVVGDVHDRQILDSMGAAIAHRGPDDEGRLRAPLAGFAFRRLAIIDLAGGNQPIWNEDHSAAIILNGEIYNHRELRSELEHRGHRFRTHSDVETVLHLWEDLGESCLQQLHGMFALAIWDARNQSLLLARDRLGKKPLYYYRFANGGLAFGSEIKAILQHPGVPRRPDLAAIDQFLTLQYVPTPFTAFEGIRRVAPAGWLRWKSGTVREGRYWSADFDHKLDLPEPELRERLLALLREAVRCRLESEVPLGAFLSGGIDSSAIVAFASEALASRLQTFSIGFADASFDESGYARLVAERFGTAHHELHIDGIDPTLLERIAWHYDQPFGDSSAVPSFQVAAITRPHVTVVLNGDGGDESFGGYDRYRSIYAWRHLFGAPGPLRRLAYSAAPIIGPRGRKLSAAAPMDGAEAYFATLVHMQETTKSLLYSDSFRAATARSTHAPLPFMRSRKGGSLVDMMLETDLNHYLPDDLLVKMDVATMAHSLEARSPLLDHRLVEFMAAVPARYKLGRSGGKHLLKSALRGLLPDEVLERPKMGFGVPLAKWLRTDLREMVEDVVLSSSTLARGYFRPEQVRRMVAETFAGADQHRYVVWDLLMLELWHRTFIDRLPTPGPEAIGIT